LIFESRSGFHTISHAIDDNVNADDDAYDCKYKETSVHIMEKNTDLRLMEMEINHLAPEFYI